METLETSPATTRPSGWITLLLVLLHGVFWGLCLWWLSAITDGAVRAVRDCRDYGLALPWLTDALLPLLSWVTVGPLFLPVLLIADAWLLYLLRHEYREKALSWIYYISLLVLPLLFLGLMGWAFRLPVLKLQEALSR
jgi:hypothetical protein